MAPLRFAVPRGSRSSRAHLVLPVVLTLAAGLLLAPAAPARAADPNLVAHWSFDGFSGADSSSNHLTMQLAAPVSAVRGARGGGGIEFGAGQGYGETPSNDALEPRQRPWSVSIWLRTLASSSDAQMLLAWYRCGANPSCGTPDAADYMMYLAADGRLHWDMRGDGGFDLDVRTPGPVLDGHWHHAVGTYSFATLRMRLYFDGVPVDSAAGDLGGLHHGSLSIPLDLGRMFRTGWATPGYFYPGALDEVRLYDRELTPGDVASLFQAGIAGVESGGRPSAIRLGASQPNPFVRRARIPFTLPAAARVRLSVLDVAGREIARLEDGEREAGEHAAEWDGRDLAGTPARGGIYFYRLVATPLAGGAGETHTARGTLLR